MGRGHFCHNTAKKDNTFRNQKRMTIVAPMQSSQHRACNRDGHAIESASRMQSEGPLAAVCRNGHTTHPFVSRVSVFTRWNGRVCKNGHLLPALTSHVSVCARGQFERVHKRTIRWRYGHSRVRFCTRHTSVCAETDVRTADSANMSPFIHTQTETCAKTDICLMNSCRMCPFVHTGILSVCISGHMAQASLRLTDNNKKEF